MCMMPQAGSPEEVEIEEVEALSGKGLTTQDPRFKANKQRKKRMNLRINKPK